MSGRYTILEELGSSGVGGAVYKAYDTQLGRYVAIKRLMTAEEAARDDAHSQSLVQECGQLAALQHPNIVSIYDLATDDEGFFIVMELLEGTSLTHWIRQHQIGLPEAYELASQMLEALVTAHHFNILHRDLKPDNVNVQRLPSNRLQVKVLDFGMARLSYAAKVLEAEEGHSPVGTAYYLAPEQYEQTAEDGRTDLYALGCIMYEALSGGRRPFDGATAEEIMAHHLNHQVFPLSSVAPQIPSTVSDWVMWLINLQPESRPESAQQALASLRALHAAGTFTTPEKVAVAIPVVEAQRPAGPRGAASQRIGRPGSGAVSQRLGGPGHSSQQLRSGPTSGGSKPAPASTAKKKQVEDDIEDNKLPKWIWPATAAVILAIGWSLWPKGKPSTDSAAAQASAQPAQAAPMPPVRQETLIQPGAVAQFLAGNRTDGENNKLASPGQRVFSWHDMADLAGDNILRNWGQNHGSAPTYVVEKPSGIKHEIGMLRFSKLNAMRFWMDRNSKEYQEYPFGNKTKKKGVSVMTVCRPMPENTEMTLFLITDAHNAATLRVYAHPNNEYRLHIRVGNEQKEAKITGRPVKGFAVISVIWDGTSHKAVFTVRTPDGGKARTEMNTPRPKGDFPILSDVRISTSDTRAREGEYFIGDLTEMIIWPFPLSQDERTLQDWSLARYYFQNAAGQW